MSDSDDDREIRHDRRATDRRAGFWSLNFGHVLTMITITGMILSRTWDVGTIWQHEHDTIERLERNQADLSGSIADMRSAMAVAVAEVKTEFASSLSQMRVTANSEARRSESDIAEIRGRINLILEERTKADPPPAPSPPRLHDPAGRTNANDRHGEIASPAVNTRADPG